MEMESHVAYQLEWWRWPSCRMSDDGWVYPDGGESQTYDAGLEEALPAELARVNRPWGKRRPKGEIEAQIEALLAFTKQFGFLGQTVERGKPNPVSGPRGTHLMDGDQLGWALAHAKAVDICLILMGAIKTPDEARSARLLGALAERQEEMMGRSTMPTLTGLTEGTLPLEGYQAAPLAVARKVVVAYIRPNLTGVGRLPPEDIFEGRGGALRFRSLIQLVYWRLADWAAGGNRLRECPDCHTWFFAVDRRQKFCPPPQGVNESRCARRYRMGSKANNE